MNIITNIKENRWMFMVFSFLVVMMISAFGRKIKSFFDNKEKEDEFELISKYLQPDNHDFNPHPRIWIYNNQTRNDPYLVFTIKSIVTHCGEYFNVCLVDDNSFSQLISTWNDDKNRTKIATQDREYGMMLLLYLYGGIIVPKSFLCLQSLKSLHHTYDTLKIPFIVENINRTDNQDAGDLNNLRFLPDPSFIGASKNNEIIKDMLHFITTASTTLVTTKNLNVPNSAIPVTNQPNSTRTTIGVWVYVTTWNTTKEKEIHVQLHKSVRYIFN